MNQAHHDRHAANSTPSGASRICRPLPLLALLAAALVVPLACSGRDDAGANRATPDAATSGAAAPANPTPQPQPPQDRAPTSTAAPAENGSDATPATSSTPANDTAANHPGLKIETLKEGSGEAIRRGQKGKFHYVGTLADGKQFDSSYERGEPFETALADTSVVKGWVFGLEGMKVGEKRRVVIPPDLGYGEQGRGGIPANAVLVFEVELVGIVE